MTKGELIDRANAFYPDQHLPEYMGLDGDFFDNPDGGDSLARFIVSELTQAVDFDQPDETVIAQAKKYMHTALGDILAVLAGLDDLVYWRGLESCR